MSEINKQNENNTCECEEPEPLCEDCMMVLDQTTKQNVIRMLEEIYNDYRKNLNCWGQRMMIRTYIDNIIAKIRGGLLMDDEIMQIVEEMKEDYMNDREQNNWK